MNICKGIDFQSLDGSYSKEISAEEKDALKKAEEKEDFEYFFIKKIPFMASFIMQSTYPELTEEQEAELEEQNEPKNSGGYYISNFFDFTSECRNSKRVKAAFAVLGIKQDLITEWRSCDYEYTCTDEMGNEVEEDDEGCVYKEWRIYRPIEMKFCFEK